MKMTDEEFEIYFEKLTRRLKYEVYLESKQWHNLRHRKLVYENFKCKKCGYSSFDESISERTLDVHHLTYERLGNEDWDDLIVLCRDCHNKEHGRSR